MARANQLLSVGRSFDQKTAERKNAQIHNAPTPCRHIYAGRRTCNPVYSPGAESSVVVGDCPRVEHGGFPPMSHTLSPKELCPRKERMAHTKHADGVACPCLTLFINSSGITFELGKYTTVPLLRGGKFAADEVLSSENNVRWETTCPLGFRQGGWQSVAKPLWIVTKHWYRSLV